MAGRCIVFDRRSARMVMESRIVSLPPTSPIPRATDAARRVQPSSFRFFVKPGLPIDSQRSFNRSWNKRRSPFRKRRAKFTPKDYSVWQPKDYQSCRKSFVCQSRVCQICSFTYHTKGRPFNFSLGLLIGHKSFIRYSLGRSLISFRWKWITSYLYSIKSKLTKVDPFSLTSNFRFFIEERLTGWTTLFFLYLLFRGRRLEHRVAGDRWNFEGRRKNVGSPALSTSKRERRQEICGGDGGGNVTPRLYGPV